MSNRKKVEYSGLELRIDIKPENKNRNFVRNSKNASDEILIMDHTFPWWLRATFNSFMWFDLFHFYL